MARVYVDCDGCLLGGALDAQYEEIRNREGWEAACKWYSEQYVDDLPLNETLWSRLKELHEQGHELVLWTNRNHSKSEMTFNNLAKHKILSYFQMFIFAAGRKAEVGKCHDGVVFDNDFRNETDCLEFNYIHTFI
jgi:phosphoglycolate phosphatase-like HAD superfamily hydrolase